MGRPPQGGAPAFRFNKKEVAEMEAKLLELRNAAPPREVVSALAEKFSSSSERVGKIVVHAKQVWNWFQNRRYSQKSRTSETPVKIASRTLVQDQAPLSRAVPSVSPLLAKKYEVRSSSDGNLMEFEAKSARDGAWYDVAAFLSHRMFESGGPEVRVRFSGFGAEEDEWIDVNKCVRQRSLPCEATDCAAVIPGDLLLCFQEDKDEALYFDAHVIDALRRRHDVRGCRCRFLVRYDHDQSEEILPLRKVCRRPQTDYRLQILQASRAAGIPNSQDLVHETSVNPVKDINSLPGVAFVQENVEVKTKEVASSD